MKPKELFIGAILTVFLAVFVQPAVQDFVNGPMSGGMYSFYSASILRDDVISKQDIRLYILKKNTDNKQFYLDADLGCDVDGNDKSRVINVSQNKLSCFLLPGNLNHSIKYGKEGGRCKSLFIMTEYDRFKMIMIWVSIFVLLIYFVITTIPFFNISEIEDGDRI